MTEENTEKAVVEEVSNKITIDDFKKVEIKIGQILTAEKVEGADKLIKFTIDFKEEAPRQILSGIAMYYPDPSVLVGKKFPFVTNLAPRMLRGLESNGMILAASDAEGKFALLEPSEDILPGTKLS
jgi:methionyl-tRNA synthetase